MELWRIFPLISYNRRKAFAVFYVLAVGLINKEQLAIDNHQDELVKHVGHRQVLVEKFNKLSAELETTGDAAAAGDLTSARRFVPYPVKSHAFSPEFEVMCSLFQIRRV